MWTRLIGVIRGIFYDYDASQRAVTAVSDSGYFGVNRRFYHGGYLTQERKLISMVVGGKMMQMSCTSVG